MNMKEYILRLAEKPGYRIVRSNLSNLYSDENRLLVQVPLSEITAAIYWKVVETRPPWGDAK